MKKVRIQMMNTFVIYIDEKDANQIASHTKKGAALMQYLILNRNSRISTAQLMNVIWDDERSNNPENALKTLVSRLRAQLNQLSDGLGACIISDRGAYHWESTPDVNVDVYELEDIFERLFGQDIPEEQIIPLYERILTLYKGDLLQNSEENTWVLSYATTLHDKYMSAVYAYIDLLKGKNKNERVVEICRKALEVDNFDERLNMELMTALINTERTSDALAQYKYVTHLNYRYLGVQPSNDMQEFYKQIVRAGKTLELDLESIRRELSESDENRGAFFCEYVVFKEIFNLQMRNLERLGTNMFLCVIMIGDAENPMDSIKQDNVMSVLQEILRCNLRKGDTITRFSPTVFAILLPTVNYITGNMVAERIKRLFYAKFPNSNIPFNFLIGPLSSNMKEDTTKREKS